MALSALNVPATVIGYFFQVLLAGELERRFPDEWRGGRSKDEKDLVYVPDPALSVEVKTSGQPGFRIFGNRSYGQQTRNRARVKKEKSGYYLTVNFFRRTLTLVRFGWIDAGDWAPQKAATGQMAGLSNEVYRGKLLAIEGGYRGLTPVELLEGVGPKLLEQLHRIGIQTVDDLLAYQRPWPQWIARLVEKNEAILGGLPRNSE